MPRAAILRNRPRPRNPRRLQPSVNHRALEPRVVLSIATPYTIPLQLVNIRAGTSDLPEYKLGIHVGLGGGEPRLYEFDTGASGFFAGYTPDPEARQWWGDFQVEATRNLENSYASGVHYVANEVSTTVDFYAPDPNGNTFTKVVGTSGDAQIGQIVKFNDTKDPSAVPRWYDALKHDQPPLETAFYGDFGAGLPPAGNDPASTIYSILPQIPMPAGLAPGYIIHLGEIGPNARPYVQLGLTKADLASTDTTLRMTPYRKGSAHRYPVTNLPTYAQQITNANFAWRGPANGATQNARRIGWVIDTGAPGVTLFQGGRLRVNPGFLADPERSGRLFTGRFKDNLAFRVTATPSNRGGRLLRMLVDPTGRRPSFNLVSASSKPGRPVVYVNTGLLTFTRYDILYDLAAGRIHFREPTPGA